MMHIKFLLALLPCLIWLSTSQNIFLPNLIGSYKVGTIALELVDQATNRDIMTSFFYPTSPHGLASYPLSPDFPPKTAVFIAEQVGVPPAVASSVVTQSHALAPIFDPSNFPILLFSPGQGSSRLQYTAIAEDIASLGYIVVTVDHPYETLFIEYPNGTVATFPLPNVTGIDQFVPFVNRRVGDLRFVLDSFSNEAWISQVPGIESGGKGSCFNTDKVGVLGHSEGGATAGATMLADRRFIAGINLDGSMIGNVTTLGLSEPFMLMSSSVHNRTDDATWATFWANLRGFKRELAVAGTRHITYSDFAALADDAIALGLLTKNETEPLVGTINGTRMLQIESAYISSFFDKFLKGRRGELLDGPSKLFPEVTFDDGPGVGV
jgi:hypothetical protein